MSRSRRKRSKKEEFHEYDFKPLFDRYDKPVPITENHKKYHNLLKDKSKKIVLCNGYAGTGKAQPLYSKLLTPNGYINMGDVKVGDEVFGEDGKPHKVIGVFPQGKKPVYELTFSDRSKCRCSDEHLWNIIVYGRKKMTVTLATLLNMPLKDHSWSSKDQKYYNRWIIDVPVTKAIDFEEHPIKIDPYVLGVILGDGGISQSSIYITNPELDIITKINKLLSIDNFSLSSRNTDITYTIKDEILSRDTTQANISSGIFNHRMKQHLYDYGLLGKLSHEKFIPKEYLINSKEVRLSILQGLLDTDGYVSKNDIIFSTSSSQLANDVNFLVQSLGGTASVTCNAAGYKKYGKYVKCKDSFDVYIKLPKSIIPVTSRKHLQRYSNSRRTSCYRKLRKIEYIGEEECQCIMVDNPSNLYLTDNMIVTHNSVSSMYYGCQAILNNEVRGVVIVKDMHDSSGFIPGSVEEKFLPKVKQLLLYAECFLQCDYQTLLETGTVVIQPLAYLQGMDYTGYIMIVDEAELITPEMMYCICSRGATRIFINGDTNPMQSTARHIKQGKDGLSFLLQTMDKSSSLGMVTMNEKEDIVRDSYIREVIVNMQPKLEEFKKR